MHYTKHHVRLAAAGAAALLALSVAAAGAALAAAPTAGPPGSGSGCDTDWPAFQHDQSHTGAACGAISPANVSTMVPGWFVSTANAVTAEPAVVGGTAYVGDNGGTFYALSLARGAIDWTFNVDGTNPSTGRPWDSHSTSYGVITSSAAYTDQVRGHGPMVFFGGGGSVFALDARTGAVIWHTDLAPSDPTGPDEVESSPTVLPRLDGTGVVIVGLDTNESTTGVSGGVVALDASTGAPLWSYEPGTATTVAGLPTGAGNGCSDVWSSPAVDPAAPGGGLIALGTGNCPSGVADIQAISLRDGTLRWKFAEPAANHGGDDDFGSSPILTSVHGQPAVVEGGKSGWIYVLNEYTGAVINAAQVAQPGQTGNQLAGAIGGFIGSMALAPVGGDPVVFGNSAIPAPFTGNGISSSGATPDAGLLSDPTRASSLHAYDTATGQVLWQEPAQLAAYAPVTETGGVLFAPSTASFSIQAYSTGTGQPLWSFPLASSPSGGVAVSGSEIVFGTGTYEAPGTPVPPQATGIWMFHLASA